MLLKFPSCNIPKTKHVHNVHVVFNIYKCSRRHVHNAPVVFIIYKCNNEYVYKCSGSIDVFKVHEYP